MKLKFHLTIFIAILFTVCISSCCIFKTDTPDLRVIGQNYPSQVSVNQTFHPTFTVGNYSNGDCDAAMTSQSIANLKMVNRASGTVQVNNTYTLDALDNNQTQVFANISITIGTAGTYDLTFTADPNHTTADTDYNNNTVTGVIVVR